MKIVAALGWFLALVVYSTMCGCGATPMQRARTTLAVTADAVVAVDRVLAPRYAAALGADAVDPDVVRRWNGAVEALLLTRSALLVAEATLDAVENGQDADYRGVFGCVVSAVQRLLEALPTVGVDPPEALTMVMSLLSSFAATCEPADETSIRGVPHVSEAMVMR
jgi:hypothetical protein